MKPSPTQKAQSQLAQAEAALSNLAFSARLATEAAEAFAFAASVAHGTDEAVRAGEIGEAALQRVALTSRPSK